MIPIGLGLALAGYTVGIWGYCLVRGYNVTFMQLFKPTWPLGGTAGEGSAGSAKAAVARLGKGKLWACSRSPGCSVRA